MKNKILLGISLVGLQMLGCSENAAMLSNQRNKDPKKNEEPAKPKLSAKTEEKKNIAKPLDKDLPNNQVLLEQIAQIKSSNLKNTMWIATERHVRRIELKDGAPHKDFVYFDQDPISGTSLYLHNDQDLGMLIADQTGTIMRIKDSANDGDDAQMVYKFKPGDPYPGDMCLTTYVNNGKKYVGGLFTGQFSYFFRIPINPSKDNGIDENDIEFFKLGEYTKMSIGSYCFHDMEKNILYSTHKYNGKALYGFDLNTNLLVDVSKTVKNFNVKINNALTAFDYAKEPNVSNLNGFEGNLIFQTNSNVAWDKIIYESKNGVVYLFKNGEVILAKSECYDGRKSCAVSEFHKFKLPDFSNSCCYGAIGDGRIAVANYLVEKLAYLTLKDPNDLSKGIDLTLLKVFDEKMIGDGIGTRNSNQTFGVAKSAETQEIVIKTTDSSHFKPDTMFKQAHLRWQSANDNKVWKGLLLKVRCYVEGKTIPDYSVIAKVSDAEANTNIATAIGCNVFFNRIGVRVESDRGAEDYTKTKNINFFGEY